MTAVFENAVCSVQNGFLVDRKKRYCGFGLRIVQATKEIICKRVRNLAEQEEQAGKVVLGANLFNPRRGHRGSAGFVVSLRKGDLPARPDSGSGSTASGPLSGAWDRLRQGTRQPAP